MKSINNNPYRIIGILAGATEKELQQRKSKIQAYARINKPIDSELDFSNSHRTGLFQYRTSTR